MSRTAHLHRFVVAARALLSAASLTLGIQATLNLGIRAAIAALAALAALAAHVGARSKILCLLPHSALADRPPAARTICTALLHRVVLCAAAGALLTAAALASVVQATLHLSIRAAIAALAALAAQAFLLGARSKILGMLPHSALADRPPAARMTCAARTHRVVLRAAAGALLTAAALACVVQATLHLGTSAAVAALTALAAKAMLVEARLRPAAARAPRIRLTALLRAIILALAIILRDPTATAAIRVLRSRVVVLVR